MNPDEEKRDKCGWCELAVRLKCAFMVMYASKNSGSCCEKAPDTLDKWAPHSLVFSLQLTPDKCASESVGGKSDEAAILLPVHQRKSYNCLKQKALVSKTL